MSPHQKSFRRAILLALFILVNFTLIAQKISLVAGQLKDGIAGTSANISNLMAVAVAPDGDLIVAMGPYKGYLRRVDAATGLISTIAGKGDSIPPAYSGPVENSKLREINGIAVDSNGDIYFTESTWIRKIKASTGVISTIAGDNTQEYAGDNGLAVDAKLYSPNNIIIKNGQLFFTDQARVRKIDLSTGLISAVVGNGSSTYSGDGGLATNAGVFPTGLAFDDSDNLYVVDNFTKIRKVDHTTGVITHFAGNGSCCDSGDNVQATSISLFVSRISFDNGGLYLISANKVRRIDTATGVITTVAGTGVSTSTGDGGPAINATFSLWDFAIFNGDIFVGDRQNGNIRKISGGMISTVAGAGNFAGDGDAALYATLKSPRGLAVDSHNNLFIADTDNNRIRKIDPATGIITTVAGNGNLVASGDGGASLAAGIAAPKAIAVDASDNLYVANAGTIRKISALSGNIETIAGTGLLGNTGNNGPAISAQIDLSIGEMTIVNNNLYFTSKDHHVVRKIDLSTGLISVVAGTGATTDSGDGGMATAAGLGNPIDVAVNEHNDIFILNNPNVRRVDGVTGIISTIPLVFPNFNGAIEIAPNGNFLVSGEFGVTEYSPSGDMVDNQHTSEIPTSAWHLVYDRDGNFYFSDYLKNMIWKGVPRKTQTIQISPIPSLKVGETYAINSSNVSASSGLTNFEFFFYSENAAVFENNVIKALKPGVAYFSVSHTGNADFRPTYAFQQVDIIKGDQTITFSKPADRVVGDAPFDLTATASSSLATTFSTQSSTISLIGKTVTLLSPGRVSIQAMQEGNSDYNAAPMVEQHFCINPAKPQITASSDGKTLTSSGTTGNQWYVDGVAIQGATNSTLQVSTTGTYTVKVTVDVCESIISDAHKYDVITSLSMDHAEVDVSIYPNPASHEVTLKLAKPDETSVTFINSLGKKVLSWNGPADQAIRIAISDLPKSTYVVRVTQGRVSRLLRFVKY